MPLRKSNLTIMTSATGIVTRLLPLTSLGRIAAVVHHRYVRSAVIEAGTETQPPRILLTELKPMRKYKYCHEKARKTEFIRKLPRRFSLGGVA